MRIALVSDAWLPQTNGVVRTLGITVDMLRTRGHEVQVVHPGSYRNFPCPTYPEIRLALRPYALLAAVLDAFAPDAVHVATEGPLGLAARRWCRRRGMPFTTSYHTQFPEYVRARVPIPLAVSYMYLRRFHRRAARTMVATPSMQRLLESRGFSNVPTSSGRTAICARRSTTGCGSTTSWRPIRGCSRSSRRSRRSRRRARPS